MPGTRDTLGYSLVVAAFVIAASFVGDAVASGLDRNRCDATAARKRITTLVAAFNRGDGEAVRSTFASRPSFRPYTGREVATIRRFVDGQHSARVAWTPLFVDAAASRSRDSRRFVLALRVSQRGSAVSEGVVTLAVDCRDGRIREWRGDVLGPPGRSNAAATTPSFTIEGTDPGLSGKCTPQLVAARLRRLLEDFNRGLGWRFTAAFVPNGDFNPYNESSRPGHRYPSATATFVRARWAAGDGWTAISLRLPSKAMSGNDVYSLLLRVTQRSRTISTGGTKIAIDCRSGRIMHWVGPLVGP